VPHSISIVSDFQNDPSIIQFVGNYNQVVYENRKTNESLESRFAAESATAHAPASDEDGNAAFRSGPESASPAEFRAALVITAAL